MCQKSRKLVGSRQSYCNNKIAYFFWATLNSQFYHNSCAVNACNQDANKNSISNNATVKEENWRMSMHTMQTASVELETAGVDSLTLNDSLHC